MISTLPARNSAARRSTEPFTGEVHRHADESSPVNFTEFPRPSAIVNTIPIETPCGTVSVKVPVPDLPSIAFPPDIFPLPFPPKFTLPMPDCSLLRHLGSAPEPAEDSTP